MKKHGNMSEFYYRLKEGNIKESRPMWLHKNVHQHHQNLKL